MLKGKFKKVLDVVKTKMTIKIRTLVLESSDFC